MTPKQQLKSIEKKMERIQKNNPTIDLNTVSRYCSDIERYSKLKQEHFHLQFTIEHCPTCFKKLKQ
jgi:hypothetical protein